MRIYLNKQDCVYLSIPEDKKFDATYEEYHADDDPKEDSQTSLETQEEIKRDKPMPRIKKSNRKEGDSS